MLHSAATTFAVTPRPGARGNSLLGHTAGGVYTPLQSTLTLLDDGRQRLALLTSHFANLMVVPVSNLLRRRVAETLGLDRHQVLLFSSHNHCDVHLLPPQSSWPPDPDSEAAEACLTEEGRQVLDGFLHAADELPGRLQPAQVRYGVGHERRITHNRKGRRADGSTYFMREEDRLRLGVDFCGDIDDDAFVVGFFAAVGQPLGFLTQFTGHPVTAYHPEHLIVHGEYPQVACDVLSAAFGGVPVGFLQGCAGDSNSKGLLAATPVEENVRNAERFGQYLGETFRQVADSLTPSTRDDLGIAWREVAVPTRPVPPPAALERRLREVHAFLTRCDADDDAGTRTCDGLNFPATMTPAYRKALIEPTRQWLEWALARHRGDDVPAPVRVALRVAALRIGDVGIVGLPCEPFLGIGQQIKQASPLPLTVPCGYRPYQQEQAELGEIFPMSDLGPFERFWPHGMTRLADGTILAAGYAPFPSPEGTLKTTVAFLASADEGRTWAYRAHIPNTNPFDFSEPDVIETRDGRLLALLRTDWDTVPVEQRPDEARVGYGYFLYQSESADGGRTWSEPVQVALWGHPPSLLRLASGSLLLVYGYRRPPWDIRAILSRDEGRTWDMTTLRTINTFDPGSYDMGYPVATQTPDGAIVCTFYGYSTSDVGEKMPHGIFVSIFDEAWLER